MTRRRRELVRLARAQARLDGLPFATAFGDSLAGDIARFRVLRAARKRIGFDSLQQLDHAIREALTP